MRKSEIADLISMARAFDDRIEEVSDPYEDEDGHLVEDARLMAWHLVLGDLDYVLAAQGLAELYREPQMMRLQPGHIFQAAERVRRRNVGRHELSQLRPPEGLEAAGLGTRHAEWMQAAVRYLGRGMSMPEAEAEADQELGVTRRALGPAVRRLEITSSRGMGRAGGVA